MAKQAIASGMPYGVGGATIEDAEKGLEMMQAMMGGVVAPIDNPNYTPPCGLVSCDHCNCDHCPCDDEDEDDENEPPIVVALADMLRSLGIDEATIGKLMQSALGM
jgi:hypothetical protein